MINYSELEPRVMILEIEKAVAQLYYWQYSNTGSFFNQLFDLISKADFDNKENLRKGFPFHVEAYELWMESEDPDQFFADYGLGNDEYQVKEDKVEITSKQLTEIWDAAQRSGFNNSGFSAMKKKLGFIND